jgi:predicted methyltransferase
VLERFVKAGMTVYDVGAQAGFYTLFFSRLVGGGGSMPLSRCQRTPGTCLPTSP